MTLATWWRMHIVDVASVSGVTTIRLRRSASTLHSLPCQLSTIACISLGHDCFLRRHTIRRAFRRTMIVSETALDRLRLEIDTLKREIEDSLYNRDALTGAENRVRMLTKLRELHELVKRGIHPCGIAIMDMDNFKTINSNYGHPMGDQVLATSVRHVMSQLRPYDSVFRYGGDEFLISLPDADLQITQAVINRILEGLATLAFATDRPKAISTTASFGITLLDPEVSVEESINRADMALFAAKTSGAMVLASGIHR